jgi:hypothetical protein
MVDDLKINDLSKEIKNEPLYSSGVPSYSPKG